jgi:tetratricopeptide (TPR) repeat protein
LPEFADAEPDYLAQHLSEAGLVFRAARTWLKAATRCARRSANLEAVAQLRTALKELENLPPGSERDDLELTVQIALIGPTIATRGYAAPELAVASDRALELCRVLPDPTRIFPALYARWSYSRVTGNIREACSLAQDFVILAEQSGTRTSRVVGHRLLGTALVEAGEVARAQRHLEQAMALHDPSTDRADALAYGTDIQVTVLCNLCISSWHLGQIGAAVAHRQRVLDLPLESRDANTLGYASSHVCMLDALEKDVAAVESRAKQMLNVAVERELPFWVTVARVFLGWCQVQSGRIEDGIETLEGQRHALTSALNLYWMPTYLCWLGGAYAGVGKLTQTATCLEQAREIIAWGGQSLYECECWRIEGLLAGHPRIHDISRAGQCLERAFALARDRGQRSFALRAAIDFAAHLVRNQRHDVARKLLQQAMQPFADQPDGADRADAKTLLRSLREPV